MRRNIVALIAIVSTVMLSQPNSFAGFDLSPGNPFPVIPMPSATGGELKSVADFRGEKVMLQIFASW